MPPKRLCLFTGATLQRITKEEHCRRREAHEKVNSKRSRQFQKTEMLLEKNCGPNQYANKGGVRGVKESLRNVPL